MQKISDLRLFVRAAQAGSFSEAARQLHLTPGAASAVVKRLETWLGTRLFERSTRELRLTPEGEAFRASCERALAELAEGEAVVRARGGGLSGTVQLALPSDLARGLLNRWLAEFMRLHPRIHLVVRLSDGVHDLLRDAVDLALRYGSLPDSRLVARPLCETRRIVCASPDYLRRHGTPQRPQDLAAHNCLCYFVGGRLDKRWRFAGPAGPVELCVQGDRSSDDSALAKQWAIEGAGLICKSDLDLADELAGGRLVRVLADWPGERVPLHALRCGPAPAPQRVRVLLDFLVERFQAHAGQAAG